MLTKAQDGCAHCRARRKAVINENHGLAAQLELRSVASVFDFSASQFPRFGFRDERQRLIRVAKLRKDAFVQHPSAMERIRY